LLEPEIAFHKAPFFLDRHELHASAIETQNISKQRRQLLQRTLGQCQIRAHQGNYRVKSVEEEMRLQVSAERRELSLRSQTLRTFAGNGKLPRRHPRSDRENAAVDQPVQKDADERLPEYRGAGGDFAEGSVPLCHPDLRRLPCRPGENEDNT